MFDDGNSLIPSMHPGSYQRGSNRSLKGIANAFRVGFHPCCEHVAMGRASLRIRALGPLGLAWTAGTSKHSALRISTWLASAQEFR